MILAVVARLEAIVKKNMTRITKIEKKSADHCTESETSEEGDADSDEAMEVPPAPAYPTILEDPLELVSARASNKKQQKSQSHAALRRNTAKAKLATTADTTPVDVEATIEPQPVIVIVTTETENPQEQNSLDHHARRPDMVGNFTPDEQVHPVSESEEYSGRSPHSARRSRRLQRFNQTSCRITLSPSRRKKHCGLSFVASPEPRSPGKSGFQIYPNALEGLLHQTQVWPSIAF